MAKGAATPMEPTEVPLERALGERYLAYALSTITSRSLPDVRDGLKPVHRRLLYAMRQLRLDPGSGFKKCARIVARLLACFINDRLDACALQRDAQCRSTNAAAHNHDML